MNELSIKDQPLKSPLCSIGFREEGVELIISPPFNPTQLLRCMGQLDRVLCDSNSYSSITHSISSFSKGTVITLQMPPDKLRDLIIRLTNLPEVERIEEDSGEQLVQGTRLCKKLRLILKEPRTARQKLQELVPVGV